MKLLDLICLIAGATGFIAAFEEGEKAGGANIAIGVCVGVVAGAVIFWIIRLTAKFIIRKFGLQEPKLPVFRLLISWLLCVLLIVLIMVFGIIASRISLLIIDLFR